MDRYIFLLSGLIGLGEIETEDVLEHLALAAGKDLTIKMNSPGGDVATGAAIRNALAQYAAVNNADIEFEVLGWAQSAASYITTLPGAKVKVNSDSLYMLHNPQATAWGDHRQLQARLDWLVPVTDTYRKAYTEKSGATAQAVEEQLDKETYLIGQEIVDAGYADELVERQVQGLAALGSTEALVTLAKQEHGRLKAAAMGGRKNNTPVKSMQGMEGKSMSIPNQQTQQPAAAATGAPPQDPPAAATGGEAEAMAARARAYGDAMRKLPATMHDAVAKAFDDGEDASYFKGMVASAEASAAAAAANQEKQAHEEAVAEGAQATAQGGTAAPAVGDPAAKPQASGLTGETMEVG
jgi:ATP-dependent protease ClpP protease subunit